MQKSIALAVACLVCSHVAAANTVDGPPPSPPRDEPSASITISPAHFLIGMVELTGELRVGDRIGVAAIAGVGRTHTMDIPVSLYEGGLSARYYAVGSFR